MKKKPSKSFDTRLKELFGENKPICFFEFNLAEENRTEGLVAVIGDKLAVAEREQILKEIPLDNINKLTAELAVGSVVVSYEDKKSGEAVLLCRSDNSFRLGIIKAVRRINAMLEDGVVPDGALNESDKRPNKISKKQLLLKLFELVWPYKLFVLAAMLLFFGISGMNLILPAVNRIAVDDYINKFTAETVPMGGYVTVLCSMLAIEFILKGMSALRTHILLGSSHNMTVDLRYKLFSKIQRLSISRISKRETGELMHRVTADISTVENFLVNYLPSMLEQIFVFIAVGIFIFIYDPRLFLMVLLPTPLVVISFRFFWKFMRKLFHKRRAAAGKTNSILHDIFAGIRVVKAFGTEKREYDRFEGSANIERALQEKSDCIWSILMPILRFFICFGEYAILFYVGNAILDGRMTLGEMAQFSSYAGMLYSPLRAIAMIPRHIMNFAASFSKIFEIMDEPEEISNCEKPESFGFEGNITLNNVCFGYDGGNEVLHRISLEVKKGEFIGLVGASGVGKSTLINLIMRMYDVEEGEILIDGVDIRNISGEALRTQMGVVLQETYLFSGSVYENIAYAKPTADREEVIRVAKLAGCHDFISRLPDGYNTRVGERGSTLSGGERQRIAIARALLHNPKILILDEATASLDTETEKQIQDALQNLAKDRTTIAIAHRLSTLRNATRLVVLDKGRVAEVGSHDELMQKGGIYHSLVMAQREMNEM